MQFYPMKWVFVKQIGHWHSMITFQTTLMAYSNIRIFFYCLQYNKNMPNVLLVTILKISPFKTSDINMSIIQVNWPKNVFLASSFYIPFPAHSCIYRKHCQMFYGSTSKGMMIVCSLATPQLLSLKTPKQT